MKNTESKRKKTWVKPEFKTLRFFNTLNGAGPWTESGATGS